MKKARQHQIRSSADPPSNALTKDEVLDPLLLQQFFGTLDDPAIESFGIDLQQVDLSSENQKTQRYE